MKKVIWIGDGGVSTGFARVNHSIYDNLPKGKYEIHHIAINYHGDPYPEPNALLYPAMLGGDVYGMNRIKPLMDSIKPDMIFVLNDLWIVDQYLKVIPESFKNIVCYFPVDAAPQEREWCESVTQRAIKSVAYTNFGRNTILDQVPKAKIDVIPHGIDKRIFYPVDKAIARRELRGLSMDDFIVLNANRNQPRKRVDLTIKGFTEFAMGKKNVKLYLHCGVEDAGWNIVAMCDRYGIADKLIITSPHLSPTHGIPDDRLNLVYNSCDVGINTSTGEGWGLPSFEHSACRRAQIVPNSSACAEVFGDGRGYIIPIDHYDTTPRILTEGAVVSPEGVAVALETLYTNVELRDSYAEAGYKYATSPTFNWKNIAKRWDHLFDEVIG